MKLQETNYKEQIPVLYIVRALAFIAVIFVHVSSVPVCFVLDNRRYDAEA